MCQTDGNKQREWDMCKREKSAVERNGTKTARTKTARTKTPPDPEAVLNAFKFRKQQDIMLLARSVKQVIRMNNSANLWMN